MAPKSEDLYPAIMFVSREDEGNRTYFTAHKTADGVAMTNALKPTRVCIYKRDRIVIVSGLSRVEELDDAKV